MNSTSPGEPAHAADGAKPNPQEERPLLTVGELKVELNRWPDHAAVHFRCPLKGQEFRFYRSQSPSRDVVEIELNEYPETPPVVPAASSEETD